MSFLYIEPRYVLGFLDMTAGLVMLWAMQRITTLAGFKTAVARWALCRRMIYCAMAFALFGLGIERLAGDYSMDALECIFQATLLVGVMAFPLLRAIGFITQDNFTGQNGKPPINPASRSGSLSPK